MARMLTNPDPVIPRVVIPVMPQPGEGISELVFRAASENFYETLTDILHFAGLQFFQTGATSIARAADRGRLAEIITWSADGIGEAIVPNAIMGRPGLVNFFGTPLRSTLISWKNRRVAPTALRRSAYLRSIWNVKAFSFDPTTREQLLSECPVCHRPFPFTRTLGVTFCAYCTRIDDEGFVRGAVDLREFPQPVVTVRDEEALDFLSGLIDPSPELQRRIRVSVAPRLAQFERGDLFEFALAIACAITTPPGFRAKTLNRPFTMKQYARFTPHVLARAGRALLDWPQTIQEIACEIRDCADQRPGFFGIRKELGPILAAAYDVHVHPELRQILRAELEANMKTSAEVLSTVRRAPNRHRDDLLSLAAAADRFGCSAALLSRHLLDHPQLTVIRPRVGKGPILLKASELEPVFSLRGKLVAASNVGKALGIRTSVVASLAEAGLLTKENGPIVSCLSGTGYYHKDTLESLIARVFDMALPGVPPEGAVRITVGVKRLGRIGDARWPAIFNAILSGEMAVWRIPGRLSAVMSSLAVEHIVRLAPHVSGTARSLEDVRLSQNETALLMSATPVSVCSMKKLGLLSKRPTIAEVRNAAKKYMSTSELFEDLKRQGLDVDLRYLRAQLEAQGVKPAAILPFGSRPLWLRSSIRLASFGPVVERETPREGELTDLQWELIGPTVPPAKRRRKGSEDENRRFLNAMLSVLRSRRAWQQMDRHYGKPEYVRRRFRRWAKDGTWDRLLSKLVELGLADWPNPITDGGRCVGGVVRLMLVERANVLKSGRRQCFVPIKEALFASPGVGKLSRFSDAQIISILKEHRAGMSAVELCRKYGVSDTTFYKWRSKYGGIEVAEANALKALEDVHSKVEHLLAEAMHEVPTLKEMLEEDL